MKTVKDHIEATQKRLQEMKASRQAKMQAPKVSKPKTPPRKPTGRGK